MTVVDPMILNAFLNESQETIESLESDLSELENDPENSELINSVFRSLHTIKGNSSFLDLDNVTSVTHEAETLLDEIRSGRRPLEQTGIDFIYAVIDILRSMVANPEDPPETSSLVAQINQYRTGEGDESEAESESVIANAQETDSSTSTDSLLNLNATVEADQATDLDEDADALLKGMISAEEMAAASKRDSSTSASTSASKPKESVAQKKPSSKNVAPKIVNMLKIEESKVERMVNLVNELELLKYSMEKLPAQLEDENGDRNEAMLNLDLATSKISRITSELGSLVFGARLVPVNNVFRRFPRIVRDLANKLDKDIELQILNGSAELDKSIVEAIADPMTHLIRNAVDHGVEAPEYRMSHGKDRRGVITLNSFVQGNSVVIEIKDDGKGMDPELILRKAVEKGIVPRGKGNSMPDAEKLGLIFAPGFSTAEKVTDISGRGVGMDVVKSNINKLKGTVQIESQIGAGTTIQLRFPLSVVVSRCLFVYVGDVCCAVPLSQMEESIQIGKGELFSRPPRRLNSGEETMAVYSMQDLLWGKFQINPGTKTLSAVRVRRKDGKLIALIVDEFSIMEETIIHSVDSYVSSIPGIQGGVIRRDGSVSLALSIETLLETTFEKTPLAFAVSRERKRAEITDLKKLLEDANKITGGIFDFKTS